MTTTATLDDLPGLDAPPRAADADHVLRVWWLHPASMFTLIALGTLLPAMVMSSRAYAHYDTPKYLDGDSLLLGVIACLAVAGGVYIGVNTGARPRRLSPRIRRALVPWFYASCLLTLFGYAVWTVSGVRNGLSVELISGLLDDSEAEPSPNLKFDVLLTIPGVTTCTQFGLLAVMLGGVLRPGRKNRTVWPLTAAVVFLACLRMFLFSERLCSSKSWRRWPWSGCEAACWAAKELAVRSWRCPRCRSRALLR